MDDDKAIRIAVSALVLSGVGLGVIVSDEGFTGRAVVPVVGDPWTFGFGSTTKEDGSPVTAGDTIAPPRAIRLAIKDISGKEAVLRKCIKVPLTQGEWDVYVNMAYNTGAYRFCQSGFVTKINALDYTGACGEFLKWKYVRGLDCSLPKNRNACGGIWDRRQAQHKACMEAQP